MQLAFCTWESSRNVTRHKSSQSVPPIPTLNTSARRCLRSPFLPLQEMSRTSTFHLPILAYCNSESTVCHSCYSHFLKIFPLNWSLFRNLVLYFIISCFIICKRSPVQMINFQACDWAFSRTKCKLHCGIMVSVRYNDFLVYQCFHFLILCFGCLGMWRDAW